ncbi:Crp/Fnr family transcriptional regulator [Mucilaginibacter flavus]|uniref:Crp/Fnr family transcriptional regulator n=1 Tax=Mucilaginibacter flavus TaxID=931504 RepID=UPI0025B2A9B8|nr:Crp/Fnr family transcriptional regulator [Mucilaginibacter flavus]MDN3582231.1 Crp/Fnr family transcriptional regulator [Mucilaginibacter flavus]
MSSNGLKITGQYSEEDALLFEKEVKFRQFEKDELLLNKGDVAKSIFFILKGAVYQYTLKSNLEHHVIDIHTENEWFVNHKSFVSQMPSDIYIRAFTACDILEVSIESIHFLIGQSPSFLQLNKVFDNSTSRVYFFDNLLTPLQKYQFIFESKPQLLQQFPLKIIASFLKITPETLSRVREKFARINCNS